jgi:hypothetical protein
MSYTDALSKLRQALALIDESIELVGAEERTELNAIGSHLAWVTRAFEDRSSQSAAAANDDHKGGRRPDRA